MNIVFICNEYPPAPYGGIGTMVRVLARELVRQGHLVWVVGIYDTASSEDDSGVRVVRLKRRHVRRLTWLIDRLQISGWIERLHTCIPVDIIEVPDWLGLVPWPLPRVKVVVRLHGSFSFFNHELGKPTPWLLRWVERRTLAASPGWIGVSQYVLDRTQSLMGLHPTRKQTIRNPVSIADFRPSHDYYSNLILYAGSIVEKKGVIQLAQAACKFLPVLPGARLVFLGRANADMHAKLEGIIGTELLSRVEFAGVVPYSEMVGWLQSARVCVFPSLMEAMPMVWIEAMACQRPVVGSRLGPGPEVIIDGETGLLCDPAQPEDIAEKVEKLYRDETLSGRLAINARRWVEANCSVSLVAQQSVAFYETAIVRNRQAT